MNNETLNKSIEAIKNLSPNVTDRMKDAAITWLHCVEKYLGMPKHINEKDGEIILVYEVQKDNETQKTNLSIFFHENVNKEKQNDQ